MITQQQVDLFIEKIPPSPQALRETITFLNQGELTKAAKVAEEDKALSAYLKNIVNKPIYGFRNEIKEISQIFSILGVSRSQQTVYNYMISLLSPSKWQLFKLNKSLFLDLQAQLSAQWQKTLQYMKVNDKEIESSIALLPASIIVSDALFGEKIEDVKLLRAAHQIDYNTILKRLSGMDLFDICERIARKWEMDEKIIHIVQAASGIKPHEDAMLNTLGKWMHLILFHTLSKPEFITAGLNDFIDFQIEFVQDIYEDFMQVMESDT